jgi:cellulose synthase/poly-beta-1,6-N-acetylglucosamine synthase-like glycosyltransferase
MEALAAANYPKGKLMIVLGREARIPESAAVAERIAAEFGDKFLRFLVTVHPYGLADEIPGKGSNEAWTAKNAQQELIDPLGIPYEDIVVSVFDADTQVAPEYFGILTHTFLTSPHPQRSSYQPIPLFTNNIFQAPALARVIAFSSSFWHMIQQSRPERLTTFSSHAMPFKALAEVGFWNTGVVSEDSQIFWQCFLHYNGDWRTVPIFYPVAMDANVAPTFWQTMKNLYKQQRRWGWGCENIPYFLAGFLRNKLIPRGKKLYWTFHYIEGFHSWATNALIIFTLGWLSTILGDSQFNLTVLSYNLPRITRWVMNLAMIGIASSAVLGMILLPPKPAWFRWYHYFLYVVQWLLMPLHLIIFGSFPALDSQTRLALGGKWRLGFWLTPKFRRERQEPV